MLSFFKNKYKKIKSTLFSKIKRLFSRPIDESTLEELEQILYETDLGSHCTQLFIDRLNTFHKKNKHATMEDFLEEMKLVANEILEEPPKVEGLSPKMGEPLIILLVGINGSGKTTTAAKLALKYKEKKKRVLLAAGDTYRAAANEQLKIWSERIGADLVKSVQGADPSSVIYDALAKAKASSYDVVIIDTAGRLESKTDLMKELEKINRVIKKIYPEAPHDTFLVLDATIGQSAIDQTKTFNQFVPLSGIILTKLDGSAKGGIILSIYHNMGIPIRYVGLGEKKEDFEPFDQKNYIDALFSS